MTAIEFLNKTINEYNKTVNNVSKFQLNNREYELFVNMMDDYANQKMIEPYNNKKKVLICGNPKTDMQNLINTLNQQEMPDIDILFGGKPKIQDIELILPKLIEQPFLKPLTRKERRKIKKKNEPTNKRKLS